MVDAIQKFPRSFQRLFIGAYVVLICRVCTTTVAENFSDFLTTQPSLDQSSAGRATETAKAQAMRFAVRDTSSSTSRLEGSLDSSYAEYGLIIAALLLFPQCFKFQPETIANGRGPGLHSLSVQGSDSDCSSGEVAPFQCEDFAGAHSGVDRADQDRPQVFAASGTGGKQSAFLFERQHANTLSLIGYRDNRIAFAERTANDPSFALRDVKDSAHGSELAINTSDRSSLAAAGYSAESFRLVGLEIGIRDRAERAIRESLIDRFGVAFDGGRRAHTGNLAIIHVDGLDCVSIEIPLHDVTEAGAGIVVARDIKCLPFLECFAQTVAGFCLVFSGSPDRFSFSILKPGYAGANVSVANDDLDFMVAGHLLLSSLYLEKLDSENLSNRERDCETSTIKNQAITKGIEVSSWVGQDNEEEIGLTSNQKVRCSSHRACIQFPNKSSSTKSQKVSKAGVLSANLYVRFWAQLNRLREKC